MSIDNLLFQEFFSLLHKLEGGLTDIDKDKGGKTNYGISTPLFNQVKSKYGIQHPIEQLTIEDAKKIYFNEFFKPIEFCKCKESYYLYFDLCVNSGYKHYKRCKDANITKTPDFIYNWREIFYKNIVNKDPSQNKFLKGWLNRLGIIKQHFKNKDN